MNMQPIQNALSRPRRALSRLTLPLIGRNVTGFAGSVIDSIHEARLQQIDAPNLDHWRYPGAQAVRYNPSVARAILMFIRNNAVDLNETAAMFEDDASRQLLAALLAYRALGPRHIKLPRSGSVYMAYFHQARALRSSESSFEFPPFEMAHYSLPGAEGTIEVDCWLGNVIANALERQYWFHREGVSIAPETGDVIVDAGGCFGETALSFADAVGPTGQVHTFEPMPRQRAVLNHNLARNPHLAERIQHHPYATASVSGVKLMFRDDGAGAGADSSGTIPVETLSIDDMVERADLENVNFIKMDVEGAEVLSLEGSAKTIKRFRPKLGISVYHHLNDLVHIPKIIKHLDPSYQIYLDHHTIYSEETILYAR